MNHSHDELPASDERPAQDTFAAGDGKPRDPGYPLLAYRNQKFLDSPNARSLRLISEYLYPLSHFPKRNIQCTIVFFASAPTLQTAPNPPPYNPTHTLTLTL